MGIFAESARENMGWGLLRFLERKKSELNSSSDLNQLIDEMAKEILYYVEFPPQEMIAMVEKLNKRNLT